MSLSSDEDRKNYVIDTSVLAKQGESIHSFPGQNLYIPIEVLEELDNLKTRKDSVGASCRYVNRFLGKIIENSDYTLNDGIIIDGEQKIFVVPSDPKITSLINLENTVDNIIIATAHELMQSGIETTVVSRDIALRVKADGLGISTMGWDKDSRDNEDFFFNGVQEVYVTSYDIDSFYENGYLDIEDWEDYDLYPNQGVILKCGKTSAVALVSDYKTVSNLNYAGKNDFEMEGIRPRTVEQRIACELLLDPEVHMVSITGMAGCGKTLLAVASALSNIQNSEYNKIIISRPVQSTSKDIGYLPGTKFEKMAPWLQPIFDNLEVLLGDKGKAYVDMMMDRGIIEVEALTYVRGRTLPNTVFIIDEAQNISHHEAKALLTRMGENSKIILIGDLEQIDSTSIDQRTSGLSSVVSLFKEFEHSGHVRLRKGERSKLATFAAKVM